MNRITPTFALALSALVLAGCPAPDETGETGTVEETGGETGDTGPAATFTMTGVIKDLATQAPVAAGLCVHAIDPTPVLEGGTTPDILGSTTTDANGAFSIADVITTPAYGMFVLAKDCGTEGTVMSTATGVPVEAYNDLAEGSTVDRTGFAVSMTMKAGMEGSIVAAGGAAVDLATSGPMLGFVFDSAGVPQSGATVSCMSCGSNFYYFDADSADGLFSTGTTKNASTAAAASAMFLIPTAPLEAYSVDGTDPMAWEDSLFGGLPGMATIAAFYANP